LTDCVLFSGCEELIATVDDDGNAIRAAKSVPAVVLDEISALQKAWMP
jgi:hypothetical protein